MSKILLVEDDQANRELLARYLILLGYRIVLALDGAQAVQLAQTELPDLILMDMRLPVMDGWEATRRLKANVRTAAIPVVALTGHALAGISEGAKKAGCDAFVTKPCLPEDLVKEIKRILERSSASSTSKTRRSGKHAKTVG